MPIEPKYCLQNHSYNCLDNDSSCMLKGIRKRGIIRLHAFFDCSRILNFNEKVKLNLSLREAGYDIYLFKMDL